MESWGKTPLQRFLLFSLLLHVSNSSSKSHVLLVLWYNIPIQIQTLIWERKRKPYLIRLVELFVGQAAYLTHWFICPCLVIFYFDFNNAQRSHNYHLYITNSSFVHHTKRQIKKLTESFSPTDSIYLRQWFIQNVHAII